jgi:hypothetical protein
VTIAHMAYAVGLSPERLESEGQRLDAAEILREILHRKVEAADAPAVILAGSLPSAPMDNPARESATYPYAIPIWEQVVRLAAQGITDPAGSQMFPDSPHDAKAWDGIGSRLDIGDRVWLIADLRRRAAARNRQTSAG